MTACEWQLRVDVGRHFQSSDTIKVTALRPDMAVMLESSRQAVLLELSVPFVDWIKQAFKKKRAGNEERVNLETGSR